MRNIYSGNIWHLGPDLPTYVKFKDNHPLDIL